MLEPYQLAFESDMHIIMSHSVRMTSFLRARDMHNSSLVSSLTFRPEKREPWDAGASGSGVLNLERGNDLWNNRGKFISSRGCF
jgi:hypothetical protein